MVKDFTKLQARQRGNTSRFFEKNKKYYKTPGIYKRGVLVRCIDPKTNQYGKYGYIVGYDDLRDFGEGIEYDIDFIGSDFSRFREDQIKPVFLFAETSIPEEEWLIKLGPKFKRGQAVRFKPGYYEQPLPGVIISVVKNVDDSYTYNIRVNGGDTYAMVENHITEV